MRSEQISTRIREQWLDKLWTCLFDRNSPGLMSPGQIRREHRNRARVRQLEMAAILDAENEINCIYQGTKALDDFGNVIDTPLVEAVSTHQIIDNTAIEQETDVGLDSPAMMIRSAMKEVSVRDLARSLNLKKIAILAESEILEADVAPVSTRPVNAEWMLRWKQQAVDVFNPELQLLWARMLIREVAHPGRYSLSLMAALHQLHSSDIEALMIAAKYTFADFIYNASGTYFTTDFHRGLFEQMQELALLSIGASNTILLNTQASDSYSYILTCRNKALNIIADNPLASLTLPIIKLSRTGRQLFELVETDTDIAYLFDLAKTVKQQGFDVILGDWVSTQPGKGQFIEKMRL